MPPKKANPGCKRVREYYNIVYTDRSGRKRTRKVYCDDDDDSSDEGGSIPLGPMFLQANDDDIIDHTLDLDWMTDDHSKIGIVFELNS